MVDSPFISYSHQKHVDRSTLSRIRSHAQQKVQDDKWSKKIGKEREGGSKVVVPRVPERQCLKLVFEKRSKKGEASSAMKVRKKQMEEVQRAVAKTVCETLVVTPVDKREPFDAFPVVVDAELMDLMEGYYGSWKWNNTKSLIFQETVSNPVLIQSCLAMAYHICHQDEVRTMVHESKTMELVASGINQLDKYKGDQRRDQACALIWAMIRLATIKVNQGQLETSLNHLNALVLVSPTLRDWEGHNFALHLQAAIASLFLANFTQSGKVLPLLHTPFGTVQTSAVADVKAQGYMVPDRAVMLDPSIKRLTDPAILDGILALTALYNISGRGFDTAQQSLPHTHTGRQAFEGVRIALRLAQLDTTPPEQFSADRNRTWRHGLQNVLRLTAVLFTWAFARRVSTRWEAISSVRNQLHTALTTHLLSNVVFESRRSKPLADLMLWILIVCGSTTSRAENMLYYAELIRTWFPEAQDVKYEDIRKLGERLPWIDVEDNPPVGEFWGMVTAEELPVLKEEDVDRSRGEAALLLVGFVQRSIPRR
ncbi:hypothetical protein PRZ48_010886 [Zasmidium cellare]|uniref:Tachykinin family protein n=1 Tax=Zasmidium cellare TaxID=395010 RepID=A0ABR0E9Y3_ZASCE|nr:hypothetical protein PRZ48_010886 [Zasmidium cellare]